MKVGIGDNEWWPVLEIADVKASEDFYKAFDISDDLLERFKVNLVEFNAIQDELLKIIDPHPKDPAQKSNFGFGVFEIKDE